jgi:hypothetical protein
MDDDTVMVLYSIARRLGLSDCIFLTDRESQLSNEARQAIPANDSSLTGRCSTAFATACLIISPSTSETMKHAFVSIHSVCTPHAYLLRVAAMHPTRRYWTNVECTFICTCKCTLSSRPLTRPTKLIDASLACLIPSSLVVSVKHVSSQTSAASQDTTSRRLRAGREQHKVETVA